MRGRAYCPRCDDMVLTEPYPLTTGPGGDMVDCCARCDSAGLYESKDSYLQAERRRFIRMLHCDHTWTVRKVQFNPNVTSCQHCMLNKGDEPEEYVDSAIDTDALREDHSHFNQCDTCGQWKEEELRPPEENYKYDGAERVCKACHERHHD